MTSLERIFHYENIQTEPPLRTPNKHRPSKDWPQSAKIIFTNFHLRYRPDAIDVLKDLNFKINSGEKVGVVGPERSGKSSIIRALFRFAINEPSEGQIEIDDINIDTLGLHDLRRAFALVPAEPILFHGSIRSNLDPCELRSDEEIWNALERVNMKIMLAESTEGLSSMEMSFSVKEMQLLYLARAILMRCKFLILDETTDKLEIE
jgi:ABC-type multidrug transport system fused ATPase/permease subunit